jgi:hypothetical protein
MHVFFSLFLFILFAQQSDCFGLSRIGYGPKLFWEATAYQIEVGVLLPE